MNQRLRLIQTLFFISSLILTFQLFNIQILKNRHYRVLADQQHWNETSISPSRGRILSADNYPLVLNKASFLVYAETGNIEDPIRISKSLTDILFDPQKYTDKEKEKGIGNLKKNFEFDVKSKLTDKDHVWVALFHKVSEGNKKKIEALKFKGIGFYEEPERFYPEGSLASFVLGFVGSGQNGEDVGYYGLEGYYDGDLKGKSGRVVEEKSASGLPILSGGYKEIPAQNGRDLMLSLNRSVQFLVEKRLKEGVEKFKAKLGTVIVMDPGSGAIIAMASYPSFDPGNWSDLVEKESEENTDRNLIFRNPAISETYEPGSVLKALTISAGIDTEAITPQTEFDDSGPIMASGYLVNNWDGKHFGKQNIIQLLQKSNNIGASFVGKKLGAEKLREYFVRFGLGSTSGIDLTGEGSGIIKKLSDWREIDLVNAAFGQGISVTPLQLVSDFSAIANGGVLYKPYLVTQIRDNKDIISFKPIKIRQVLNESKSKVMVDLLTAAAEGGEGKFFILKKYRVAGKTGTAQIPIEGHYDPNKSNATFIGFLPNSFKFVMLVRLKEPGTSIYAAETAVPLWMDITKDLVNYYGIPPDK